MSEAGKSRYEVGRENFPGGLFFVWDNEAGKNGPLIVKWRKTELGAIEWARDLNEADAEEKGVKSS